jgi:hypothetical protein
MNPLATLREMLDFMVRCATESGHGFSEDLAGELEKQIRRQYPAERIYVPPADSRKDTARQQRIIQDAKKLPTGVVAARHGVSRSWALRVTKK